MTQIGNSRSPQGKFRQKPATKVAKSAGLGARRTLPGKVTAQIRRAKKSSYRPQLRRMPVQQRSQETNLAIVDAAEQVLVQVGYARASTNAIARRAGVSVGSLYQYFDDKESVFRAVVRRHHDEMMPLIRSALAEMVEPGKDTVAVTLDLMRQMARANVRNPRLMVAIESELGWLEHETDDSQLLIGQVSEILSNRTKLPAEELPVTAQLMVVTVAHLSRWLVHGKPPELDTERFIAATGRMLHALLLEPKRGSLVRRNHSARSRY